MPSDSEHTAVISRARDERFSARRARAEEEDAHTAILATGG